MWVLYFFLLLLYLAYLTVAVPLAMAAAAIAYTFGVPVSYLRGLAAVLGRRPDRPPEPAHWPKPPADGDPALLQYFYGPARADAAFAVRVGFSKCQRLWEFGGELIGEAFEADASWLTVPLGIGGAIGLGLGTVAGAPIAAVIGVIHLLGIAVSAALVRACGALLRLLDSVMLRVKNVKMVCPNCYERVPYPAYACPSCRNRHRDVRPGRYGILHRRCNCGTPMSTLLLLGSAKMEAFCPHRGCGHPLEHRPGEAPEIVLPFFGATGAGKTRLLYSMITQLQEWTASGKLTAEFGDSLTADGLQVASTLVRSGRTTIGTPVQLPRANVIRLSVNKSTRILQLYDAAGERFYEAARTEELRYLNKARTFVLVIDPLSVESFWQQLAEDVKRELGPQRSTAPSPDLAYQQTYQQIESMGVPLSKARLAVVFSRADLVGEIDGDAAEWARADLGLGNLIRSIAQNFKETRYFRTAAVMDDGHVHTSVAELLGWLLARDGIRLPAGESRPREGEADDGGFRGDDSAGASGVG